MNSEYQRLVTLFREQKYSKVGEQYYRYSIHIGIDGACLNNQQVLVPASPTDTNIINQQNDALYRFEESGFILEEENKKLFRIVAGQIRQEILDDTLIDPEVPDTANSRANKNWFIPREQWKGRRLEMINACLDDNAETALRNVVNKYYTLNGLNRRPELDLELVL